MRSSVKLIFVRPHFIRIALFKCHIEKINQHWFYGFITSSADFMYQKNRHVNLHHDSVSYAHTESQKGLSWKFKYHLIPLTYH